ncbi:kinase, PfkB family [Mobiluncus mulieris 28-1]|uniref:PfkB family carbohydrate kinase n=1 Tax=Mobiluncus mulieris TaxID=2052 RepID=UPI0001BE7C50|nr:PfkB family carbohydrate kinase [Mobiluncus mulieris]EEZ91839.1 kinase, PfkB family [Mobiluncus mulieris 28-1]
MKTVRFISTQTISLELPLQVSQLPESGCEVQAAVMEGTVVAGGFFLAATVARQCIAVAVASTLGTGPNSVLARRSLGREGISVLLPETVGDIGIRIVTIDEKGVRTTITSPGVEAEPSPRDFTELTLRPDDRVLINLNDLVFPQLAQGLYSLVDSLPDQVHLVVNAGPQVGAVDLDVLVKVLRRADLLTLNRQQSEAIGSRLGRNPIVDTLRRYLQPNSYLVLRDGAQGAMIQENADSLPLVVPAFPGEVKDTTGMADAHTGVLVASLMHGKSLEEAAIRANAAATLVFSQYGHYKVPKAQQIDHFLASIDL